MPTTNMGVSLSCPFAKCSHVEDGLDSIIVKSINFANDETKTPVRSVSFKNEDSEPTILKSIGSGKMMIEACVSFKRKDIQNMISTETMVFDKMDDQSLESKCQMEKIQPAILVQENPKHMAAIKLQKVYKSFRTRRKLADCAVLIEQSWWKLLDFAELKHSSVSFFDIEKHETAISRWSRARTRAAKVGKGLSKDIKAQKLALLHWLEAIDPRHRYGHNLHFYYDKWLKCQSREPFFYWLDIGEGKEINLEKCPRAKLQQQCVKYLGPMERLPYEVVVKDGRLFYKQSGELLHTAGESSRAKWIFVLSTSKTLYVGKKKKGSFQHSSFLAGGAASCAGRLVVEHGVLKAVWPQSGHYRPTGENFKEFISFLEENNVDLSNVKMAQVEEDSTGHMSGLEDEEANVEDSIADKANLMETENASAPKTKRIQNFGRELTRLEIPQSGKLLGGLVDNGAEQNSESFQLDSPTSDHQETAHAFTSELDDHTIPNQNISDEKHDDSHVGTITSRKEMKSYQLGNQLSCKWTTGAGPRIGCVRNHPCELQFRVLEQVNLSPRNGCLANWLSRQGDIIDTNYSYVMSE